jgi:predicted nucleic acid-binding protein
VSDHCGDTALKPRPRPALLTAPVPPRSARDGNLSSPSNRPGRRTEIFLGHNNTTPYCFYETMNVLKGKWKHKGQLTPEQYLDAAFRLTAWYGASSSRIKDLDFTNPSTFAEAKDLAQKSGLDLSDAFQILSVKKGYFAPLVNDSATILVTADKELADAARVEGLRVWNPMLEPAPQ